jgi:hypothetical protein
MGFGIAVESLEGPARLNLLDFATGRQHFEVAVDGPQTDAGKSFSHPGVQFVGSRVRGGSAQFFQYDLPLASHPQVCFCFHDVPSRLIRQKKRPKAENLPQRFEKTYLNHDGPNVNDNPVRWTSIHRFSIGTYVHSAGPQ